MDDWRHISECLDSGLMSALIGGESGCNRLADAGTAESRDVELVEPTEEKAVEPSPAELAGGRRHPLKLVVNNRGRVASQSRLRRLAARPRLITVDGVRVDHAALANLAARRRAARLFPGS